MVNKRVYETPGYKLHLPIMTEYESNSSLKTAKQGDKKECVKCSQQQSRHNFSLNELTYIHDTQCAKIPLITHISLIIRFGLYRYLVSEATELSDSQKMTE